MHLPSLLALLALAGSSLATPSKRVSAVQIQDFSARRSENEGHLQFTVHGAGSNDNCTVSCYLRKMLMKDRSSKSDVQPGLVPMTDCTRHIFQFGFRYGIGNIENFSLAVKMAGGSQTAYEVISAQQTNPSWICSKDSGQEGAEFCEWQGTLRMEF